MGLGALSLVPMWITRGCKKDAVSVEVNVVMEKLTAMSLQKCLIGNVLIKDYRLRMVLLKLLWIMKRHLYHFRLKFLEMFGIVCIH